MQVRIRIRRHVVVDRKIDSFDINPTPKYISGHADSLVELLELLVAFDTVKFSCQPIYARVIIITIPHQLTAPPG